MTGEIYKLDITKMKRFEMPEPLYEVLPCLKAERRLIEAALALNWLIKSVADVDESAARMLERFPDFFNAADRVANR